MYTVDLDPDQAKALASSAAYAVMLDVPQGTVVGVDQQAFAVGPKFKGLKMVPPGVHFFSWQAAGAGNQFAPTVSCFVHLEAQRAHVWRWDASGEVAVAVADEDEVERIAAAARRFELDANLAPYALGQWAAWRALSCHITPAVLQRLAPVGGLISIMHEAADLRLLKPKTEAERKLVEQLEAGRAARQGAAAGPEAAAGDGAAPSGWEGGDAAAAGAAAAQGGEEDQARPGGPEGPPPRGQQEGASSSGRCFYSRLPGRGARPAGGTGQQVVGAALTAAHLDKSDALAALVAAAWGGDAWGLLGELEFAFIAFVYGQSLDGYEQWKALLGLLLGCERAALGEQAAFYEALMEVLLAQFSLGMPADGSAGGAAAGPPGTGGGAAGDCASLAPGQAAAALVEELLPSSFLRGLFRSFFEVLADSDAAASAGLKAKAARLEAWLRQRMGWDFRVQAMRDGTAGGEEEGEDDEYGPVVVELSEEQLRMLE